MNVTIVDDFSTDNTVNVSITTIGTDKRFKVLRLSSIHPEKPDDWNGKSYALQQGSSQAHGEWLVFIDADISLSPDMIHKAVAYAIDHQLDFLSVLPGHLFDSFWTKVVQPVWLTLLLLNIWKVNKKESKVAFAFGCFIVIKHSVFDAIGGYETIKDKIVDDCELARLVKRSGFTIGIVNAQEMTQVKWYERFSEIWQGCNKNIFLGFTQNTNIHSRLLKAFLSLIGFIILFSAFLFPLIIFIGSFLLGGYYHLLYWEDLALFSLIIWVLGVTVQYRIQKRYAIGDPKYAWLSFLGAAVLLGIYIDAVIKIVLGKGIMWRGRAYNGKKNALVLQKITTRSRLNHNH